MPSGLSRVEARYGSATVAAHVVGMSEREAAQPPRPRERTLLRGRPGERDGCRSARPARRTRPLLGTLIVAVPPIAVAGALPTIVLVGATRDIAGSGSSGHWQGDKHAVAPITSAPVVVHVTSIDIPRDVAVYVSVDIEVAIDVAIDVARHISVDVAIDGRVPGMATASMKATASAPSIGRVRKSRHTQEQ